MKTKQIHIASNTSGNEGSPGYVLVTLTQEIAKDLLKYKGFIKPIQALDSSFYCMEFFRSDADFGTTDLEIGDEWVQVPDEDAVAADTDITANTLKITTSGVFWAACLKHCDGNFESEELSWKDIEQVAAGNNPFKMVEIEQDGDE